MQAESPVTSTVDTCLVSTNLQERLEDWLHSYLHLLLLWCRKTSIAQDDGTPR
jgi:hypothetical protein